jgi:hypothetical protein
MAKFKLADDWFSPSDAFKPDNLRVFSGQLYKRNTVIDVPEDAVDRLPKSAVRLDKAPEPVKEEPLPSLRDLDVERYAADQVAKKNEEADKAIAKNKK